MSESIKFECDDTEIALKCLDLIQNIDKFNFL